MIIAITMLLIVSIICGTVIAVYYIDLIHTQVNEYTLKNTYENTEEILTSIKVIYDELDDLKEKIK